MMRRPTQQHPATARTSKARGLVRALAALSLVVCLTGCVSQEQRQINQAVTDYYGGQYQQAATLLQPLAQQTNGDFVLNNLRLGSSLLAAGNLNDAQRAFLQAYEVINSLGVNNGGRTLGAVLVSEDVKIWKGEPFEKAMANFDLGLTYYIQHDYANARGAFENALFKLHDYDSSGNATGEQESNFAPARLMLARAWQRLGRDDLADQNFQLVANNHPDLRDLADPAMNAQTNVLLVIAYGVGPKKVRESDGDIVGFAPKPREAGPIPSPDIFVDGRPADVGRVSVAPVDLLALAQERHWQSIDTIRTIKSAIGSGLIFAGIYQQSRRNSQPGDAAAFILAGLLLKATSQADIRQWEMLPRTVFLIPMKVSPGSHNLSVQFPGLRQDWRDLSIPAQGETTLYFRLFRPLGYFVGR